MVDATTRSWDRYWAQGRLHSCTGAYAGNYEGPVRARWESWAAELPQGARVVDLGTGNGAVAAIVAGVGRTRSLELEVHGVDLADIDPMRTVPDAERVLEGIRFHPRTSAAAMPFEAGSVQAVIGQYALEYTPVEAVLDELARVLAGDGRAAFVIHHSASIVMETTRADLAHTDLALARKGVLDAADRMLARLGTPGGDPARQAFNRAAGKVTEAIRGTRFPDLLQTLLGHLGQILEGVPHQPAEALRGQLAQLRREVEANRDRLRDLAAAAVDGPGMERLCSAAEQRGLLPQAPELLRHDAQRLMGWWLELRR